MRHIRYSAIVYTLILVGIQFGKCHSQTAIDNSWLNPTDKDIVAALKNTTDLAGLAPEFHKLIRNSYQERFLQKSRLRDLQAEGLIDDQEAAKLLENGDHFRLNNLIESLTPELKAIGATKLVQMRLEHHLKVNEDDVACLRMTRLEDVLQLTEKQNNEIKRLGQEYLKRKERLTSEWVQKVDDLLQQHKRALRQFLNPVQKDEFDNLVGLEVPWYKNANRNELFSVSSMVVSSGDVDSSFFMKKVPGKNEQEVAKKREEFIERNKLAIPEKMQFMFYNVIKDNEMWKQCELLESQIKELKQYLDHVEQFTIVHHDPKHDRLKDLIQGAAKIPIGLDEILEPHQKRWLLQAELQLWLKDFRDSIGLMSNHLKQHLELSVEQNKKISNETNGFSELKKAEIEKFVESVNKEKTRVFGLMLDVLNDEQRDTYQRSVGFKQPKAFSLK